MSETVNSPNGHILNLQKLEGHNCKKEHLISRPALVSLKNSDLLPPQRWLHHSLLYRNLPIPFQFWNPRFLHGFIALKIILSLYLRSRAKFSKMYMAYGWPQVIPLELPNCPSSQQIVYLKVVNRLLLVVAPTHIELWSSSQVCRRITLPDFMVELCFLC